MNLKFTIKNKVIFFSIFFLISLVILWLTNNYIIEKIITSTNQIVYDYHSISSLIGDLKSLLLQHKLNLDEYLFTGNPVYYENMRSLEENVRLNLDFIKHKNIEINISDYIENTIDTYFLLTNNLIFYYDNNPTDTETLNVKKNKLDSFLDNAIISKLESFEINIDSKISEKLLILEKYKKAYSIFTVFMIIIFCLIVTAYSFVFVKSIIIPLNEIKKATRNIARGNFELKLNIKSNDEFEELARDFNIMSDQILKSKKTIESHAKILEKKVKERTKELNDKIEELTRAKTSMQSMMKVLKENNKKLLEVQKKLEKSLAERKKLDKEKDMFTSIAAHEMKTPMTAIHGFSQLLRDDKIIENKELRTKYLNIIEDEINRLSTLVTDLLDLTRIDLGTIKFIIEEVDIEEIIKSLYNEMLPVADKKGLNLSYEVKENLKIKTDKEKIYQILLNLVSNAIKYTEKGFVKIIAERDKEYVKFTVRDTGIGIPKEYHKKIFTRFFQVDPTYTRKEKGHGLGLSLCKELVEKLGGNIWFESDVGKGTSFYFTLPINYK